MLNKDNVRELAYLVKVEAITPMNADRLECAHIGGWHCVVGKGEFQVGDPAVYFEIDSQLPDVEPFSSMEFLKSKKFKIKSQKIRGEISQGLLMPVSAFGWTIECLADAMMNGNDIGVKDDEGVIHMLNDGSRFLTKQLGVTYAVLEDNTRKSSGMDKYKAMATRRPNIFKQKWARWLMRRSWGRKLMFFLFGKKRDKKSGWPIWVKKTDEERIQNCAWILNDTSKEWIATEKIDGSSTTFTIKGFGKKQKFLVCSRNVVFDKPDKKCFYETNIYTEMAEKYDMENKMKQMLDVRRFCLGEDDTDFITIQAETYGAGVQRRDYGKSDHDMAIFNIIFGYKSGNTIRLNPIAGKEFADFYKLPYVPVLGKMTLPNDCDKVLEIAAADVSQIDGGMREGIVFRSLDGVDSFKAVSNEFLLKYHG